MSGKNTWGKSILIIIAVSLLIGGVFILKQIFQSPHPNQRLNNDQAQTEISTVNFPQFPVYPQAILVDRIQKTESGEPILTKTWQADAPLPQISQWYIDNLPSLGWQVDLLPANPQDEHTQLIVAFKNTQKVNLSLIKAGTATSITADFPQPIPNDIEEEMEK